MPYRNGIIEAIGNTPLIKLKRASEETGCTILGKAEGRTGIAETEFPSRSYYFGKPWFLAPAVHVYRLRDRLGI